MSEEKWSGEIARDRLTKRIIESGAQNGQKPTSEQAHRQAVEIVQRREKTRKGK